MSNEHADNYEQDFYNQGFSDGQAELDSLRARLAETTAEAEKFRKASSVLCAAHIGLPQAACPVCEVEQLQKRLDTSMECADGWAWVRDKLKACTPELTLPLRNDELTGTKYEVMGWLHVLCAYAQSANHAYLSIAVEQQKRAEEAEARAEKAEAEREELRAKVTDYGNQIWEAVEKIQGLEADNRRLSAERDTSQLAVGEKLIRVVAERLEYQLEMASENGAHRLEINGIQLALNVVKRVNVAEILPSLLGEGGEAK